MGADLESTSNGSLARRSPGLRLLFQPKPVLGSFDAHRMSSRPTLAGIHRE